MANPPAILDSRGRVVPAQAIAQIRQRGVASGRRGMGAALSGRGSNFFAYDAAAFESQEFGDWFPTTRSPDSEINPNRDRVAARARDLHRNDPWAKGAIGRILDSTIGSSYRPVSRPDYRALALYNPLFDASWAAEFGRAAEALWRNYSDDLGRWADRGRRWTMSQMFRLALGHKMVDGESVIVAHWRPDRLGPARASYATCFQGVDPDRLSNPYQQPDTRYLRGGVEMDDDQVAVAYHIRRAHQFDTYNAVESMTWEQVDREDPDGWRRVYHDYDADRFEQSRGISIFAPVIGRLKMLAKFYNVKLAAETVASAFGIYVTSPFDRDMVRDALELEDDQEEGAWSWYQGMRSDFHQDRAMDVNGVRMATLAPGEKIETVAPGGNTGEFSPFTHEMLRGVGQVLGLSGEQVTNDAASSSWSAMRGGIAESEKTFLRRTQDFDDNTATPIRATWMEEPFARGELPLPRRGRIPSFAEMRTAYARCRWLGTPRGWVDPVSERQGEVLGMAAGFNTLEAVCARQGSDWEENLDQRGVEMRRMEELGLPFPQWMNSTGGETATESAAKPKTQEA